MRLPRISGRFAATAALALLAITLSPAQTDIEKALSPEEFEKTGLSKLTAGELAVLDGLLKERRLFQADEFAPKEAKKEGGRSWIPFVGKKKEKKVTEMGEEMLPEKINREEQPAELKTRLVGYFSGLSGGTVFQLENGQVWQQRFNDTYYLGKPIKDPSVTLVRVWNGYRLIIDDLKMGVAVKRLE